MINRKISKGVLFSLIAIVIVSSIANAVTVDTNSPTVSPDIHFRSYKCYTVESTDSIIVWDNEMEYENMLAAHWDDTFNLDAYPADDFRFDDDTMVTDVHWVGGYWGTNYTQGDFDWDIIFYEDRGDEAAPGVVYVGPFTYTQDQCNPVLIDDTGGAIYYEFSVDLPEIITFAGGETYWLSISAIGLFPPQSGWGVHSDNITMHQAVFKSVFFGFPDWNNTENVLGYPVDMCFQLILVDDMPPTATITTPENGDYYKMMNIISGSCNDTGLGINKVNLTIYNVSANKYWSGSAWVTMGWLNTTLTGSPWASWSYNSSGVTWYNGTTYYINATAKDNASNVGATDSHSFFYDVDGVSSQVDAITTYWHTSQPLTITGTASDSGSGVKNVTLWYRYRATNSSSWSTWMLFGTDLTPWPNPSWSFTFTNNAGHYEFYSRAYDNVSNYENAPLEKDTLCGYDINNPTVEITKPARGVYIKDVKIFPRLIRLPLIIGDITIEVNASDLQSGVERVEFYGGLFGTRLLGNDTTAPYSFTWKRDGLRFIHLNTLKVVAYDMAGNSAFDSIVVRKIL